MIKEQKLSPASGGLVLVLCLAMFFGSFGAFAMAIQSPLFPLFGVVMMILSVLGLVGLCVVQPNEGKVLTLFGKYTGTVREAGFWWVNPFTAKRSISLRARNFESAKLKVNDLDGSPIEIAAIIVWKVDDTAEACFNVENYERYVSVQAEVALRALASHYPYDAHEEGTISLRGSMQQVADKLKAEVTASLQKAGVEVVEARISHLAYAPEIAQAMLQRQQAGAIIAARQRIVEGAVGMVEMALAKLEQKNLVVLDAERKAAMVSNLLVVLCGERGAQPVLNTGTLYTG